ncbi:MAG TPA: response regulator [Geothrix sp.]|nr:response regulator [Geothrix sp.]
MRILMVDENEARLQEARKAFWQKHRHWEVLLAPGAEEAFQVLNRDPVDMLITALHLPGMDGAELLHRTRTLQPGAVRILLAEAAAAETVEKAEGDLHRIFLEPVTPAFLIGVVESLDSEDDEERVRAIRAAVGGLGHLPSLPSLYSELVALLQREDTGMKDVARLVRKDVAIAAQVLKMANSVHFSSGRTVTELGQAVAMLGVDSLRSLVLFRGVISGFNSPRPAGLDLEQLWLHSFAVAAGTRKLVLLEGQAGLADMAFSVGLLHDIGLIVFATDPTDRYRAVLEQAQLSRIPLAVLEHDVYGVDHTQLGAHLLSLWGLPPAFCRPVREHHAPSIGGDGFPLSAALHMADAKHGGGRLAGIFADGRWGLHPNVLANAERYLRWRDALAAEEPGSES